MAINKKGSKKGLIIVRWLIALLVIAAAGGTAYYFLIYQKQQTTTTTQTTMQTAAATTGNIVISTTGTGTLIPRAEASFGFQASGQITKMNVKVNDVVQAGQVLAELDNSAIQLQISQAEHALAELTSASSIAAAGQTVATAMQTLKTAQNTADSLFYKRASDTLIDNTEGDIVLAKQQLARASDTYRQFSGLDDSDSRKASALVAMTNAQLNLNTLTANLNWYVGKPSEIEAAVARANLDAAKAGLQEAQWYLAALKGEEIPANATGALLTTLENAKQSIQSAKDTLNDTLLVAPISGTVMLISAGIGDLVGTTAIITIDDLSQPYILTVYLDETDWANVKVNYAVEVTFDVFSDQTFSGEILSISPGLVTANNSTMVSCVVQLNEAISTTLPNGTAATVDVISGKTENAVLVPVEALHDIGSGKYTVFVMENGTPKLRVVEVGLKDLVSAEILSGLKAGEVVTTGIVETKQ
jgi:HlyD family secretion protein